MRIAILGAGGIGVCAALEIARSGHQVDLYERDADPLQRASRVNEGKIHQGFLYAKDRSLRTTALMADGALAFSQCLSRWLDLTFVEPKLSTPFIYAVHRDTMVDVASLRSHFQSCCAIFNEKRAGCGLRYLARDEPASYRELTHSEIATSLDPAFFLTAFVTSELAVDPRDVADRLRTAVLGEPRVTFVGRASVDAVERRSDGRFVVGYSDGARQCSGPYDQVVNATWDSRLAIDRSLGISPERNWVYRHKFGNRVPVRLACDDLPSITMVLGPFGDIVNFQEHGFYLSWYPVGMIARSAALAPPAEWYQLAPAVRADVFERSLRQWSVFCPKLDGISFDRDRVDPSSGVIFAWGETDIDDPESKLHHRYEIGVQSVDGYHTVNTGKYTMVPYLGLIAARRVLGLDDPDLRALAAC